MSGSRSRMIIAALPLVAVVAAGCAGAKRAPMRESARPAAGSQAGLSPAEKARADSGRPPYTAADVRFMSNMIGHHAQAVLMAGWAPTHEASPAVRVFAERIAVAQRDEIAFVQRWLRERREVVPSGEASHQSMPGMDHSKMAGMDHSMMPGMLTPDQLKQLDAARGPEFDRLFLTFMIQHHNGAITMVDELFGSRGAGQDDAIFKFASDVQADQTSEINRMNVMLDAMAAGTKSP